MREFLSVDRVCGPRPHSMRSLRQRDQREVDHAVRPTEKHNNQSEIVEDPARAIDRFCFCQPRAPPAAWAPDHRLLPSAKPRELFRELDPFVGAHPPLHPAAAPSSFLYGGRSSKIFLPTLFCRSLFMMHLWVHLMQQSTLLLLEME